MQIWLKDVAYTKMVILQNGSLSCPENIFPNITYNTCQM